jgi:hypothetical protein
MFCNVCKTGETFLERQEKIPNLSSDSGTSTGLSDVCGTRTTVGGPNDLGGSVIGWYRSVAILCRYYKAFSKGFSKNSPRKISSILIPHI